MKLLTEQVNEYRTLYEAAGDGNSKNLFIEGVFLQSNIKNRNGRIYPKHIMDKEVKRYIKESVERKNAFGELNHPQGPTINLDKVSHITTSLTEDGNNYIGKAKILDTPMGLIVKNIIEGGGQLAVSSRGVGSVKRNSAGTMEVQEDFMLATCADIVGNPSAPDAYVDAILEAPDWFFDQVKQEWVMQEAINDLNTITKANLDEAKLWNAFQKISRSFDLVERMTIQSKKGGSTPVYKLYDWGDRQVYSEAGEFTTAQLATTKLNQLYKSNPNAYGDLGVIKIVGSDVYGISQRGSKFYQSKISK